MLKRVWKEGNSPTLLTGMLTGATTMEKGMNIPQKTKNRVTIWSTTSILDIYLDKNIIWKDTCAEMFTVAIFRIAKTWKQHECPSMEEWIKMWYILTMEYYSVI